jgi:hypothetical protein
MLLSVEMEAVPRWRLDFGVSSLSTSVSVTSLEELDEWPELFDATDALCGDPSDTTDGVAGWERADNLAIASAAGLSPGGEEEGLKTSA